MLHWNTPRASHATMCLRIVLTACIGFSASRVGWATQGFTTNYGRRSCREWLPCFPSDHIMIVTMRFHINWYVYFDFIYWLGRPFLTLLKHAGFAYSRQAKDPPYIRAPVVECTKKAMGSKPRPKTWQTSRMTWNPLAGTALRAEKITPKTIIW